MFSTVNSWSQVIGPVWEPLAYIFCIGRSTIMANAMLSFTEAAIIRILTDSVWKRMPPIVDDFFQVFFTIANLLAGMIIAGTQLFTNESGSEIYRLTGRNVADYPKPGLELKIPLKLFITMTLTFIVSGIIRYTSRIFNLKRHRQQVAPLIDLGEEMPPAPRLAWNLNNQARNIETYNATNQLIIGLFWALTLLPSFLFYHVFHIYQSISGVEQTAFDLFRTATVVLTLPTIMYMRNPVLRNHAKGLMRENVTKIRDLIK